MKVGSQEIPVTCRMSANVISANDELLDINGVRQTDSMSNLSDMSGNTAVPTNRSRMDVACVIDLLQAEHLPHRKCAFDELKQACSLVNANLQHIQVSSGSTFHSKFVYYVIHFFFFSVQKVGFWRN